MHDRRQFRHRPGARLGVGGIHAADIDPLARGVGWLLSESGMPERVKAAYLTDDDIRYLAARAASLRRDRAA